MSEEDHRLRMMRPEHLWHERFDYFDIRISPRCVLYLISLLSNDAPKKGWRWAYLDVYSVWILSFPGTVHDSDLHKITSVSVKMSPGFTLVAMFPIRVASPT